MAVSVLHSLIRSSTLPEGSGWSATRRIERRTIAMTTTGVPRRARGPREELGRDGAGVALTPPSQTVRVGEEIRRDAHIPAGVGWEIEDLFGPLVRPPRVERGSLADERVVGDSAHSNSRNRLMAVAELAAADRQGTWSTEVDHHAVRVQLVGHEPHLLEEHRVHVPGRTLRREQSPRCLTPRSDDANDVARRPEHEAALRVAAHRATEPLKRSERPHTHAPRGITIRATVREEVLLRLRPLDQPATVRVAVERDRIESRVLVVLIDVPHPMPEATPEQGIAEDTHIAPLVHGTRDHAGAVACSLHDERSLQRSLDGDVDALPTRFATVLEHEHRVR